MAGPGKVPPLGPQHPLQPPGGPPGLLGAATLVMGALVASSPATGIPGVPGTLEAQSQLVGGDRANVPSESGTDRCQPLLARVRGVVGPWERGQGTPFKPPGLFWLPEFPPSLCLVAAAPAAPPGVSARAEGCAMGPPPPRHARSRIGGMGMRGCGMAMRSATCTGGTWDGIWDRIWDVA